jgi:hypothetical protein
MRSVVNSDNATVTGAQNHEDHIGHNHTHAAHANHGPHEGHNHGVAMDQKYGPNDGVPDLEEHVAEKIHNKNVDKISSI